MIPINRFDNSVIGRWIRTVDFWLIGGLMLLCIIGIYAVFVSVGSRNMSLRLADGQYLLAVKQSIAMIMAWGIMLFLSLLSHKMIKKFCFILFAISIILIFFTVIGGDDDKGASRWIKFPFFSLQPSEFLKPALAVVVARLLQAQINKEDIPALPIVFGLTALCIFLLFAQPDYGQSIVLSAIVFSQIFLAGISFMLLGLLAVFMIGVFTMAYFALPHVQARITAFLEGSVNDFSQIDFSLKAFANGGLFGHGPGSAIYLENLADGHNDFIFASITEVSGVLGASLVILLMVGLFLRVIYKLINIKDIFVQMACAGIIIQFCAQTMVHMASTMKLIPTKGMTLPFVSYGGSSLLAMGVSFGIILALTRNEQKTIT